MRHLLRCALYAAALGVVAFVAGRLLPKRWFDGGAFPYRDWPFERGGNIYRKLYIQRWQNRVPDMSRLFKRLMPPMRIERIISAAQAERMVQETCVAECVHVALCVAGLYCLRLWPGRGGRLFYLVYVLLGNLPFIMIQRFNRPKLRLMAEKLRRREARLKA